MNRQGFMLLNHTNNYLMPIRATVAIFLFLLPQYGFGQEIKKGKSTIYVDGEKITRATLDTITTFDENQLKALSQIVDVNEKKNKLVALFFSVFGIASFFTLLEIIARMNVDSAASIYVHLMAVIGLLFSLPATVLGGILWLLLRTKLMKRINQFNNRV